jgi:hypothetical protein
MKNGMSILVTINTKFVIDIKVDCVSGLKFCTDTYAQSFVEKISEYFTFTMMNSKNI